MDGFDHGERERLVVWGCRVLYVDGWIGQRRAPDIPRDLDVTFRSSPGAHKFGGDSMFPTKTPPQKRYYNSLDLNRRCVNSVSFLS